MRCFRAVLILVAFAGAICVYRECVWERGDGERKTERERVSE